MRSTERIDGFMKKFKISVLCVLLAVAMTVTVFALERRGSTDGTFQTDSSYMTAENLALQKGGEAVRKLTDGDVSTTLTSYHKRDVYFDIDLGSVQPINCIILKEKGLNVQSFSLLVSEDGAQYQTVYKGDKIEYHRLCTFDTVSVRYVRVFVHEADRFFRLKEVEVYFQPQVESDTFRNTAYVLSSDFSAILQDASLSEAERDTAVREMLGGYNFAALTHVNFYCGVSFDSNGTVFVGSPDGDGQQAVRELAYMVGCMRAFGDPNLKITYVIGIGSGDPATNPAMDANREVFIGNLIALANQAGFDGIDIDYEFPQSDYDYQVFGDFLVALKARMTAEMDVGEACILSCAFGTRDINYPAEVVEAIDIVNMMTYDIFDADGQHASFWSVVQGAKYLESIGFSKAQINIGIPFYGTQTDALMEQYIYKDIAAPEYYENTYTVASYLDNSPTQVYFNSPAMVRDKTAYALLAGYGGIMVWHFSCDTAYSSENSLWRAVNTTVEQFGGAQ